MDGIGGSGVAAGLGATLAGVGGGVGRGICMMGTLTSGNFGWLVLKLSSTCRPGGTSKPCGKLTRAVNILPGCISLISAPTPLKFTWASLIWRSLELMLRMETELVMGAACAPAASVM